MHINYLKSLDKLTSVQIEIEKLIISTNKTSFEDMQISRLLQNILDEIRSTILDIEYFDRQCVIGILTELPNGRFELNGHELTCGSPLEIYSTELSEWIVGRIEYRNKYYFCANDLDHLILYSGIQARIRV
ncbi:DUF5348 domain-containing protein [Ruminiclostridium cellobioparum]|uniref:DUF5348 domain-containing protein n=1 Tax=Ruminiclostridium cellobioparum TaxID=29355 RepID=UPI0028A9F3FD|nr:DUF5348 domain-containing protein [Ruminiclostridium cellobioparum]